MAENAHYHYQAFTLDPNVELPDEPLLAVGHTEEEAAAVAELHGSYKEASEAEVKAEEEEASKAESEDKPKPSELLAKRERREAPESSEKKQSKRSG